MHYVALYPQNGARIVAIDSVTSLHPMYTINEKCIMVHWRVRPWHFMHDGLVMSRRPQSFCARRRNDVTRSNRTDMPLYDPLCAKMPSSTDRKYITYLNAAKGGSSDSHR